MMSFSANKGFTLIEILIVVVIVSILMVLGVQMLNSGSVERNLQQHGNVLKSSLHYACDQATFQNRVYGIKFYQDGYGFSQLANNQWTEINSEQLNYRKMSEGFVFNLSIDGQKVLLPEDELKTPQIVCNSNGMLTPFEITLSDSTNQHHFQLKTTESWEVEGKWIEKKS